MTQFTDKEIRFQKNKKKLNDYDGNIILFKDLNLKSYKILENTYWGRSNKNSVSSIHSVSSYLAMFSPEIPYFFIKKYSKVNSIIMDNFSGRGTTGLASRELNRRFIGNDLNPYAYVVSKFKLDKISKLELIATLNILKAEYFNSDFVKKRINYKNKNLKELTYFYSTNTLRQLLFLRDKYGQN